MQKSAQKVTVSEGAGVVPKKVKKFEKEFFSLLEKEIPNYLHKYDPSFPSELDIMLEDPWLKYQEGKYTFVFYGVGTKEISKILDGLIDSLNTFYWNNRIKGDEQDSWFFAEVKEMHFKILKPKHSEGTLQLDIQLGSASGKKKK